MIGTGIFVLAGALIEDVETEIDVEPAVAIVVGYGCAGEGALRRRGEVEGVWLLVKFSVAVVQEEQRAVGADYDEVLAAVIVNVDEEGAGGVFDYAYAAGLRDVFEGAVAAIAVEAVGQASGLADVEIVEAVIVDVADGDAVVSVDVDAAGSVEDGAPVVGAVLELGSVGGVAAKRGGRDVGIDAGGGAALGFLFCLPAQEAEVSGRSGFPGQIGVSDSLLAVDVRSGGDDFIANAGVELLGSLAAKLGWARTAVDPSRFVCLLSESRRSGFRRTGPENREAPSETLPCSS